MTNNRRSPEERTHGPESAVDDEIESLEASAARASFEEDHSVGTSRASVKRSHRAEGRNHVD